jgi:hypothetical protein
MHFQVDVVILTRVESYWRWECFFRAVSLDLTGKEEHFNYVRKIGFSLSYFHFLAPPFNA